MPREFTGSLDTPTNMRFGADEFVSGESPWAGVVKPLENLAAATNNLALQSMQNAQEQEIGKQDEYYAEARQLKRKIFDSAQSGDAQAEAEYMGKLENLKIAERQGAISGTNAQVRKESLLRSYINRFPHLEEQLRRQYSSTSYMARLERAEREQFKDPIETGVDEAIKTATSLGMGVGEYLNLQRRLKVIDVNTKELELQAKMGANVENEVDQLFNDNVVQVSSSTAGNFLSRTIKEYEAKGIEFDAGKIGLDLEFLKQQEMVNARRALYGIRDRSSFPDGAMSREFIESKIKQIEKVYDDVKPHLESFDTLKAYERIRKIGTERALNTLGSYNPLAAFMISIDPSKAAFMFQDFDKNLNVFKTSGMSRLDALRDIAIKAGDAFEATRLRFQKDLIRQWYQNGDAVAQDFRDVVEHGVPPQQMGDVEVDAHRLNAVTSSALGSPNVPIENKVKTAKAALAAEQQWSGPGEYLAPTMLWVTDPNKSKMLQNPEFKAEMTQNLDNSVAGLSRKITSPEMAKGLNFVTDLEREQQFGREPWKAYPTGGPWIHQAETSGKNAASRKMAEQSDVGDADFAPDIRPLLDALNHEYWIYRKMHGAAAAEEWANQFRTIVEEQFAPDPEGGDEGGVSTFQDEK